MALEITRYGSTPMGTFGKLKLGELELYTVEQPWNHNKKGHSCIPAGTYRLEPHNSQAHPHSFAFVNHDLGVYHHEEPGAVRSECLLHTANFASQLRGCVAPGIALGCLDNDGMMDWAVLGSSVAMKKIRNLIAAENVTEAVIVWDRPGVF